MACGGSTSFEPRRPASEWAMCQVHSAWLAQAIARTPLVTFEAV
jgi:hypothetical protein